MAEVYIPSIKDFDFFFKFLFAYFFIQVWSVLTGQNWSFKENFEYNQPQWLDNNIQNNTNSNEDVAESTVQTQGSGLKKLAEKKFRRKVRRFMRAAEKAQVAEEAAQEKRERRERRTIGEQRKFLFQFIFLSLSMIIFAFTMIGFLGVPGQEIVNISLFIFTVATLLKYLFDFSVTSNQVYMIVLAGLSLYVDELF